MKERVDKRKVVERIQEYLAAELKAASTSSSPDAEQAAAELSRLQLMYRFLPIRELGAEDVVCPAALVELQFGAARAFYFIAPQGGGLITEVDGHPVQVLTPRSPIGEALMGRRVGDRVQVQTRGGVREYMVLSIR